MIKILLLFLLFNMAAAAQDTCSRTATINHQSVLVDSNSTQKGEGLRFYLNKDKIAESYLDRYQKGTEVSWKSAAVGSLGTSLMISSLFVNGNSKNKSSLLIGGTTLIFINFLMARTLEKSNEENLTRSIDEYNKRNLPRILFNKELFNDNKSADMTPLYLEKNWSF